MKMKQIAAKDMQEAMALARRDLGDDAILLNTRKVPKGIVVTFATEPKEDVSLSLISANDVLNDVHIPEPAARHVQVDHPALDIVDEALMHHAIPEPMLSRLKIATRGAHIPAAGLIEAAESVLSEAFGKIFSFKPLANDKIPPTKALMFVGPHGAGKTTAIAKLATMMALQKKPVMIISTDTERLGGADALAGLADIIKAPLHIARDRSELKGLIKPYLNKAWILVDSFGVNIYEFNELKALGEFASLQDIEPVLVCPAGIDAAESQEMASVFSFLPIERMIITRADATRHLSNIFSALSHARYALSNISNSARPTESCAPLTPTLLARLMLRTQRERTTH